MGITRNTNMQNMTNMTLIKVSHGDDSDMINIKSDADIAEALSCDGVLRLQLSSSTPSNKGKSKGGRGKEEVHDKAAEKKTAWQEKKAVWLAKKAHKIAEITGQDIETAKTLITD